MGSLGDVEWLLDHLLSWLSDAVLKALATLWGLLEQTAFTTPDVTQLPQVQRLSTDALFVVDSGFGLVIVAGGILMMGRDSLQVRYGLAEFGPRLVVAFVAANFSKPLCQGLTTTANALTGALTGDAITAKGSFGSLRAEVSDVLSDPAASLLAVAIGLIIAGLAGSLLVLWMVRLGLLVVLVGVAPIALACHALPQTNPMARLWWRSMLGVLGTVMAQAVALHEALTIFLDPKANVRSLGIPNDPSGVFNLFLVACLLWAVVKIPSLMRRYVTNGMGRSAAGNLVRVFVVQQLTRGLSRVLRRVAASSAGRASRAVRPTTATQQDRTGRLIPRVHPRGRPRVQPRERPRGVRLVRAEPYTPEQLAAGVDLYTRALKRRIATPPTTPLANPPAPRGGVR